MISVAKMVIIYKSTWQLLETLDHAISLEDIIRLGQQIASRPKYDWYPWRQKDF